MMQQTSRFDGTKPTVDRILAATGTAGASVGIVQRGQRWCAHFGFRDHARSRAPDDDTLYTIGSLTKGMIAQALATLVEEGQISWDTRVKTIIPDFNTVDPLISEHCTIDDLLCHRSGLPSFNVLWYQGGSISLVKKDDLIPMINAMRPAFPFRSSWGYTNWGYALLGLVIERLTGKSWSATLETRVWEPLKMTRTNANPGFRRDPNVAEGFSALPDLSLHPLRSQECDVDSIMGAAGGVNSTLSDLLTYYSSLLQAFRNQTSSGTHEADDSPLRSTSKILCGHAVLDPPVYGALSENTYGYGWVKTKLPCPLGLLSDNPELVPEMPTIARGTSPQTVLYHQGCLSGVTTCVILLPEIEASVVTLVNTRAIGDSADWIAQLLVETLVEAPHRHDFVALAHAGVKGQASRYPNAMQALQDARTLETKHGPLQLYYGRYLWTCDRYFFDILQDKDELKLRIQDRSDQLYRLEHYQYDEFTWLMTDEEEQKRGRFIQATDAYRLSFERDDTGSVVRLVWNEMGGGKGIFRKA